MLFNFWKGKNFKSAARVELMTHRFIVNALSYCATLLGNSYERMNKIILLLISRGST